MVNDVRGSGKEPNAELFVALVISLDPQVQSLGKKMPFERRGSKFSLNPFLLLAAEGILDDVGASGTSCWGHYGPKIDIFVHQFFLGE